MEKLNKVYVWSKQTQAVAKTFTPVQYHTIPSNFPYFCFFYLHDARHAGEATSNPLREEMKFFTCFHEYYRL